MMPPKTIQYYLTPVSPWTYLGAKRFRQIAETHQAEVMVRVVDYGTIFPKTGGIPLPKRAPERRAYRLMDLKRFRDYLDIPLVLEPKFFPSQTRLSAHTIVATAKTEGNAAALIASEAILGGLWADDRNMDEPEMIIDVLNQAGLDGKALVDHAERHAETLSDQIKNDTELALADGVFGAPSYVYNREVFWGQDRLDLLAWRLGQG
jgi:2-hydroxychromene-2-carboxylate isomerase